MQPVIDRVPLIRRPETTLHDEASGMAGLKEQAAQQRVGLLLAFVALTFIGVVCFGCGVVLGQILAKVHFSVIPGGWSATWNF